MNQTTTFGMCVEPGPLELQALMFVRSLRRFGGALADSPVIMVSPRGKPFTASIKPLFEELGCSMAVEDLNTDYPDYPLANKPFAAAWIADRVESRLWFLDCDTLIVRDLSPLADCIEHDAETIARCVWPGGFKGVGSHGPGDENEPFWMAAYALCGAKHEPFIDVPWGDRKIRGYWNSGVILSRKSHIFHEWLRCFRLLRESSLELAKPYYQEQLSFALAMASLGLSTTSFAGVNTGLERVEKLDDGELFIIHYAGPGQKKMVTRDGNGKLLFAKTGIKKHASGREMIAIAEESLKDYDRAINGR